jgi:hypothetical protein
MENDPLSVVRVPVDREHQFQSIVNAHSS